MATGGMEKMALEHVRAKEREKYYADKGIKMDEDEELMRHLTEMIYRKIVERTARPQDQYREAYRIFGAPNGEITLPLFKNRMQNMGLVITDEDLEKLFHRFDDNNSGNIDFHEMIKNVMPKDYGFDRFGVHRAEKNEFAYIKHAMPFVRAPKLLKFEEVRDDKVDLDHIVEMIHNKIVERTKRSQDQYREAYRLFRVPGGKITEPEFARKMKLLGLVIDPDDLHSLFIRMDDNENGVIDFAEMVRYVMPRDLGYDPYKVHRSKAHEIAYINKAMKQTKDEPPASMAKMPSALDDAEVTVEDYENLIQRKLLQRVKRSSNTFAEAVRVVGARGGKCDINEFQHHMKRLGVYIPTKDIRNVFAHLSDGPEMDVHELLRRLLPQDFTGPPPDASASMRITERPRVPRAASQGSSRPRTPLTPARDEADWAIPATDMYGRPIEAPETDDAASRRSRPSAAAALEYSAAAAGGGGGGGGDGKGMRPSTPAMLVQAQKDALRRRESAAAAAAASGATPRPRSRGSVRPATAGSRGMGGSSASAAAAAAMSAPAIPAHIAKMDPTSAARALSELSRSGSRRSARSLGRPRSRGGGGGGGGGLSVVDIEGGGLPSPIVAPRPGTSASRSGGMEAADHRPTSAPAMRRTASVRPGGMSNVGVPSIAAQFGLGRSGPVKGPVGGPARHIPPRPTQQPSWARPGALRKTQMLAEHLRLQSNAAGDRAKKPLAVGTVPINYGF